LKVAEHNVALTERYRDRLRGVLDRASYFPAQKAVFDDRATNLGARTDRQVAADKV
jgi:hypothetical protein